MQKIAITILFIIAPIKCWAGSNTYKDIATELVKSCKGSNKTIAVADLSYSDGHDSRDGGVVTERITTELVKSQKINVTERKEIAKVLQELKLQSSGAIDPNSAANIGKILGADWVICGTLTELRDMQLELNIRVVAVESGTIISAASGKVKKDWLDQYRTILAEENAAIKENSKNAKAFYERGKTNRDLQKYDAALADFGIAIALSPTYGEAYYARGSAYIAKRENKKAIEDYTKAIELKPDHANAYFNRGISYGLNEEHPKAIEDFSKVIELQPTDAAAYYYRGDSFSATGEYDKGISDCNKAIELDSTSDRAYIFRGNVYRASGDVEKALTDYTTAIKITPDTDTFVTRAEVYVKKKEYEKAIADLSRAIGIDSQNASAYALRGVTYYSTDEFNKALLDCKKAIRLDPTFRPTLQPLVDIITLASITE